MRCSHRLTTLQLLTLMVASAAIGAIATFVLGRSGPERAGAATIAPAAQKPEAAAPTAGEKQGQGRPVVHFEIGCRDSAKTREFYSKLFDWRIHAATMGGTIDAGGSKGIDGHITALGHEPQHYVTVYVQVDDIKAYLDKATALGGKTLVPAIKIPTGHFAWIADPDGNIIGLLHPKAP
jgi:predicted enzyme related to lactoylglutathione lyase